MASRSTQARSRAPRVGVDVGGTFTDFVVVERGRLRIFKRPSTPGAPERAVLDGLAAAGLGGARAIVHGSTIGTNALLQRRGARTLLVTTAGFRDVLEIGRQTRPELYAIEPRKPSPLVPRRWRLEVAERVGVDGEVVIPLDLDALARLESTVRRLAPESAAVCLLFSFLRPSHERAVRAALRRAGLRSVSISSEVLPEHREFERTSTTVMDAYIGPTVRDYLRRLNRGLHGVLWIVQSNGGVLRSREAAAAPIRSVLSGPAAGVVGARTVASEAGLTDIVTLDMGGTSTDVSICPGEPLRTTHTMVAGVPVAIPMTDIHTVGAGGGSIASQDEAGALRVGPASAGADPGPAAYGRGGEHATVTDANVVLGRLAANVALGDAVRLDRDLAERAIDRLGASRRADVTRRAQTAIAVIEVANAHMERALRVITLERGYDPRDFALVAFGGAGPLHACDLAQRLEIETVMIPRFPGVLSALGALAGDHVREYARSVLRPLTRLTDARLRTILRPLEARARRDLAGGRRPRLQRVLEMRYVGQSFELSVPLGRGGLVAAARDFHRRHQRRYAHCRPGAPLEVVVARVVASVPQPALPPPRPPRGPRPEPATQIAIIGGRRRRVPVYDRASLPARFAVTGPAILTQSDATTWMPPGWRAQVETHGSLIIRRSGRRRRSVVPREGLRGGTI